MPETRLDHAHPLTSWNAVPEAIIRKVEQVDGHTPARDHRPGCDSIPSAACLRTSSPPISLLRCCFAFTYLFLCAPRPPEAPSGGNHLSKTHSNRCFVEDGTT